ncbi:unnamed protein product [Rotaria magnacalcarata]
MSFGFDWDLIWVSRANVVGEQLSREHLSWNRLIDNQCKLYEELISRQQDLNNHIPLHIARLQQLENQLKQQQYSLTNDKKDEKLNEIIQFIQDKLLPLFDEDLILKFFGQNNSSSNEREIQVIKNDNMEKCRNCQIAKLTASTDGVGVKQTEAEIDWSGIDTVPVLLDPVLTSNGTHPNSISDALREAVLNGSTRPGILF